MTGERLMQSTLLNNNDCYIVMEPASFGCLGLDYQGNDLTILYSVLLTYF